MTSPSKNKDIGIFSLYNPEGKEERKKQRDEKKRSLLSKTASEIGMGVTQGLGDIAGVVTLPEAGINKLISMAAGEDIYKDVVTPGQKARFEQAQSPELSELQKLSLLEEDDDLMPMMRLHGGRGRLMEAVENIPSEGKLQEGVRRVTRAAPGLQVDRDWETP